jgi:biotin operon repressor
VAADSLQLAELTKRYKDVSGEEELGLSRKKVQTEVESIQWGLLNLNKLLS